MYLTYLQENFKPVAHRSASVEVFDEEDVRVVHLPPSVGDAKELEVVDAMDAEDHGESVQEFLLERDPPDL